MRCAVFGCRSGNQGKAYRADVKFLCFPKDPIVSRLWVMACCRADIFKVENARVCSRHFEQTDYERNLRYELLNYLPKRGRKLKSNAVPSLLLPKVKGSKRRERHGQHKSGQRGSTMPVQHVGIDTRLLEDTSRTQFDESHCAFATDSSSDNPIVPEEIADVSFKNRRRSKMTLEEDPLAIDVKTESNRKRRLEEDPLARDFQIESNRQKMLENDPLAINFQIENDRNRTLEKDLLPTNFQIERNRKRILQKDSLAIDFPIESNRRRTLKKHPLTMDFQIESNRRRTLEEIPLAINFQIESKRKRTLEKDPLARDTQIASNRQRTLQKDPLAIDFQIDSNRTRPLQKNPLAIGFQMKSNRRRTLDEDPLAISAISVSNRSICDNDQLVVEEVDADEKFLLSCLPALKKLKPTDKSIAKMRIQQVLFDVGFGAEEQKDGILVPKVEVCDD